MLGINPDQQPIELLPGFFVLPTFGGVIDNNVVGTRELTPGELLQKTLEFAQQFNQQLQQELQQPENQEQNQEENDQ